MELESSMDVFTWARAFVLSAACSDSFAVAMQQDLGAAFEAATDRKMTEFFLAPHREDVTDRGPSFRQTVDGSTTTVRGRLVGGGGIVPVEFAWAPTKDGPAVSCRAKVAPGELKFWWVTLPTALPEFRWVEPGWARAVDGVTFPIRAVEGLQLNAWIRVRLARPATQGDVKRIEAALGAARQAFRGYGVVHSLALSPTKREGNVVAVQVDLGSAGHEALPALLAALPNVGLPIEEVRLAP